MPRKAIQYAADIPNAVSSRLDGRTKAAKALKAAAVERDRIAAELLDSLNRKPTGLDRLTASNAASLQVTINALEAQGKDATQPRKLLVQLLRQSGLRPQPVEAAKKPTNIWEALGIEDDGAEATP